MFYKSILQSILTFCLICVFGNMRSQDRNKMERVVKQASKIIGYQQESSEASYKSLICNNNKSVFSVSCHPLHVKFLKSSISNRFFFYKEGSEPVDMAAPLFQQLSNGVMNSWSDGVVMLPDRIPSYVIACCTVFPRFLNIIVYIVITNLYVFSMDICCDFCMNVKGNRVSHNGIIKFVLYCIVS